MITVSNFGKESERRPMLFSKAIEGFILDAKGGRYSPAYIPTMHGYLKYMCNFFKDPELESLTADHWKSYLLHLHTEYKPKRFNGDEAPLKLSSIDNHWKTIRGFYNWAVEALEIERPDLKLPRPKYESPQMVPFTKEEVEKLIEASQHTQVVKESGKTYKIKRPNADRDKAIILILLDTGIRLGELKRLCLGDVNLEIGEIYIRPYRSGRKSKARTVFLGARSRQAIWKYIAKQQSTHDQSLPLFELQGSSIRLLINRIGENAGVHAHPHKFRHTFAISYLRNHGDIFTLQRLLGHSTLDMTKKYLDIAKTDIAEAHKYASPVDNWRL